MRTGIFGAAVVAAGALAGAGALAHHSTAGIFDASRTIEVTGRVTEVSWRNPHGRISIAVEAENGESVEWHAETAAASVFRIRGIEPAAIDVGEVITIAGAPHRRGEPELLARNVLLSSGYEFDFGSGRPHFPAGKSGNLIRRAPEDVDVDEAIANAEGIFRVWATNMGDPAAFPMFKGGYPLSAAGEAGQADWDPLDNALLRCGTKGTPIIMITPAPVEFVRQGEDILMRIEEYDARRLIHMGQAQTPMGNSLFGFSRGRWEGETLVVETDHIAAGYFDPDGVPQSDQISVVERFIPNADYTRLDYRITVTDPVNFTEPFDLTRYFVWKPEMSVHAYECLERY